MKFTALPLLVLLLALSGCVSNGGKPAQTTQALQPTGTGTLVIKPIAFKKDLYIREAVRNECNLDGKLAQFIEDYTADQFATIITDGSKAPADAQVLTIEIDEVMGAAGGAWSGAKAIMITGEVSQNGKVLGDFRARRYSGGGMFAAYKGTCSILGRCTKALGRDVAEWLRHPMPKAALGDL
ncbi:hypothetical protein [Methylomarinum vadi]|uniref:hypothetical protein n=1 Tax=Methylomarinum vadi TaxID=438855 RepID=UPI001267FA26|nr:hypothetical protein [Methylomarinum vadi]